MLSPNNLPLQLTSFIGRELQIAEVKKLLSTSRLLTLTGAGGSGKTRLAVEVASQVLDHFPDGVFFVNLAPITDANLVVSSIAQTLDVKEAAGQPLLETLKAHLQDKEMLLVLDNFEQVVEAAPMLNELLLGTTYLKVLVTSRVALHLYGEQQYHVPPLQVPDAGPGQKLQSLESLSEYEAVRLFVERAQSARADFSLTEGNAQAVAQLCARLDGLPLAIELAAARVRVLTPQAMLPRLERRLKLLTGGEISRPARHQTLRAAIEWSYDLLSEEEKQLFRRMAVFQGGSSLEAVEAVCNYDGSLQVEVLEGVESLVSKSLLQQREGRDGGSKLWMLETIHEYAREKLQESGEDGALQKNHTLYFIRLAEQAEPQLRGPQQSMWYRRLGEERDNFLLAIQWALNSEEAEIALRLCAALRFFFDFYELLPQGQQYIQRALAMSDKVALPLQAKALKVAGNLAWAQFDYPQATTYQKESLALYRQLGDRDGVATALTNLAYLASQQADYGQARTLLEESLAIHRDLQNKTGMASSLTLLGYMLYREGAYTEALSLYQAGLSLRRELGDEQAVAISLHEIGELALEHTNYATARSCFEESLTIARKLEHTEPVAEELKFLGLVECSEGNYPEALALISEALAICREREEQVPIAWALRALGEVYMRQGDYPAAHPLYEEALRIFREAGTLWGVATLLSNLGRVIYHLNDFKQAEDLVTESLVLFGKFGSKPNVAVCLASLGSIALAGGQPERAARLFSASQAILSTTEGHFKSVAKERITSDEAAARARLGEAAWRTAWSEGQAMNMEQAIEYALEDRVEPESAPRVGAARAPDQSYPSELTPREVEVLRLLTEGLTNEQIAARLFLTTNTVRAHLHTIYSKLGVPNRAAATRFAVDHRLV